MTTSNTQPSRLLALPAELRLTIYDSVFEKRELRILFKEARFQAHKNHRKCPGLILLRVNQQLRRGTLPIFLSRTILHLTRSYEMGNHRNHRNQYTPVSNPGLLVAMEKVIIDTGINIWSSSSSTTYDMLARLQYCQDSRDLRLNVDFLGSCCGLFGDECDAEDAMQAYRRLKCKGVITVRRTRPVYVCEPYEELVEFLKAEDTTGTCA